MLRNVIVAYLANIRREREFDSAFLALLQAMGFRDVHLTHGTSEKGKDFIAKSPQGQAQAQWIFQSKKGDINLRTWRGDVHPQLLECATTSLQHPEFDPDIPRVTVLVCTGNLKQEANDRAKDLAEDFLRKGFGGLEIWSSARLADLLLKYGLEGLRGTDANDAEAYGQFLSLYGQAVRREVNAQDLEEHSQSWLRATEDVPRRKLIAALETAILSERLSAAGALYEAIQVELCGLRAAMVWSFRALSDTERVDILEILGAQLKRVAAVCEVFVEATIEAKKRAKGRLEVAVGGAIAMVTYPVACARFMEACGLLALLVDGEEKRGHYSGLLAEFVCEEPGCSHPISDKFAVSTVIAVVALARCGRTNEAARLVENSAIWIADRYDGENGMGLAGVDDTTDAEIERFLGWPFDFLDLVREKGSLTSTALIDMAAALGLAELYSDVVNDFKAVNICPNYYQASDTESQFFIEGEEVVFYSNSDADDELHDPNTLNYADHARREPATFRLTDIVGPEAYMGLAALLRDRWFISIARQIIKEL